MSKGLVWKVHVYWDAGVDEWIVLANSDVVARKKAMKLSNEVQDTADKTYKFRYIEMQVVAQLDA